MKNSIKKRILLCICCMLLSYLTITAQESTDVFFQYSTIEQDTRSDNHGLTWNELEITTLQAPIGGGFLH